MSADDNMSTIGPVGPDVDPSAMTATQVEQQLREYGYPDAEWDPELKVMNGVGGVEPICTCVKGWCARQRGAYSAGLSCPPLARGKVEVVGGAALETLGLVTHGLLNDDGSPAGKVEAVNVSVRLFDEIP